MTLKCQNVERSLAPEPLKPRRVGGRVLDGVLNVAVSEVRLQRPRIMPFVGERITAGVPEHMWVRFEPQLGLVPCPLDHASKARGAKRRSPL